MQILIKPLYLLVFLLNVPLQKIAAAKIKLTLHQKSIIKECLKKCYFSLNLF